MSNSQPDPRIDRLYKLLPAIYRMRDAEQKYPLQALLRVIAEQVNVVEDDIAQLYENWFIETAEEWAVPYVADLIGYRPALDAGQAADPSTDEGRELNRFLIPRRDVANTIGHRRRKGTLALLEMLAKDVADWPARAVEFFRLLGWNQNLDHLHPDRATSVALRRVEDLELIEGSFERLSHSVDVRRINSHRTIGRYNIPSVGVYVWRLKPYSVTHSPAFCEENNCYRFSVLGQDAQLFMKPEPESEPTHIAEETNVPAPIRRLAFDKHKERFYGEGKSLAIWVGGWAGFDAERPVPAEAIIPADLTDWQYAPPPKHVAVDPVLGRFAFPVGHQPEKGVRVLYHYAFSADIGGGEYSRPILDPSPRQVRVPDPQDESKEIVETVEPKYYRVGKGLPHHTISGALHQWKQDNPWDAVIELIDNTVHTEAIAIHLGADRTLQIRAANGVRPVIWVQNRHIDLPDALSVTMGRGSRLTLDGLLITGRPVHIRGLRRESPEAPPDPVCASEVLIRHCTLVPGWGIDCDCNPEEPAEPSLELYDLRARVRIEHSILGSIQVHENEVNIDPIPLRITDSILDATAPGKEAIGAPQLAVAHVLLTILRCTVWGIVDVHAVELAENCIFDDCVNVARRQRGCMRFCYVPPGCRTPRRYHCQPDMVTQAVIDKVADPAARAAQIACEQVRVRPGFTSVRYGTPGYAQLSLTCADEIKRGADDESEMGAFHDLFQPQREANLRVRLDEFTPAGMDVGLLFAT